MTRIVVIGSGFGGLASALRLQARGYEVTLLEKRSRPGGRAYQLKDGGYTFDMGPSIITAPDLLDDLFSSAGVRLDQYLTLKPLEPYYRIYFGDGRHFDYGGDQERLTDELRKFDPDAPAQYARFMEKTGDIYRRAFADLAHQPFLSVGDFLKVVPELAMLRADRSVYSLVSDYFTDPSLRMAYSFHPLFIGGNPFRASAIYSIVPFLERGGGVHFAMGGAYALIEALVRRFRELGGHLECSAEVIQIEVERGAVRGVVTQGGRRWPAAAVVSNADVVWTYARLIDRTHRRRWTDRRITRLKQSMSCFLLYLGLNRQYDRLLHHTIIMSPRYQGLIGDIFDRKLLAEDFSLYVHAPTRTDPSMAPPGHESVYLLAPVPNLTAETDWKSMARPFRDRIIRFLERDFGLDGLEASIEVEHTFTPLDFRHQLNAFQGSAFSIEPVLLQSAYFRPHNRSEDVEGLYLAGAGTHPGAGLPGTLLSAEIVDRLVATDVPLAYGTATLAH
ncbi:MAG: phytoene desaturase [Chloroflexi bacterium]|nr:phytoene desaturase [Chloroflexota bacterium]